MSRRTLRIIGTNWIGLLSAALALSVLAAENDTLPGDRAITEWLQDQALPGQALSDFLRAITTTEVVLVVGAVLSIVLWLMGHHRQAILLASGLAVLAVLQTGVKEMVDRPRPDPEVVAVRAGRSSPSFPAGHVMSGVFLYGFLLYLALRMPVGRAAGQIPAIAAALVVCLSGPVNVWVGAHWPSDVLGGYLWAGVILLPLFALDMGEKANTLRDLL